MATANAREKARQEQRETREQEIADGHAEAEAVTRTLQGNLTELRTLLTGTLARIRTCRGTVSRCRFWPPSSSLRSSSLRSCLRRRRPISCQSR